MQMEISFFISFKHKDCNSTIVNAGTLISGLSITCQYGCSGSIASTKYKCIEFSSDDDYWSFGSNVITHDFSAYPRRTIAIGTESGNWIQPFNDDWNVSTTFNLIPRKDLGRVNSSPHAVSLPLQLQSGCYHTIPITVSDPDGDVVRCRWAVGKECDTVCNEIPGAVLNSATCTITYHANQGIGYKVVAVMVEDFIPGSSQPLSSVALQFLVLVVSSSQPCYRKPKFISPTPSSGSQITISPGGTFTAQLRADSGYTSLSITKIQIACPIGVRKGVLQRVGYTNDYYVTIKWKPHVNQTGMTHHFCFITINSAGIGSGQSCIMLKCAALNPMASPEKLTVYFYNISLPINFSTSVRQSDVIACKSNITFFEYNSNKVVHKIVTSASISEISFDKPKLLTVRPKTIFTVGSSYYANFTSNCAPYQLNDRTLWTFLVVGKLLYTCMYIMIYVAKL